MTAASSFPVVQPGPPATSENRAASRRRPSHVVALGGGTGLPVILKALRRHVPPACRITAVVAVTDDGGSSGALRERYGVLPPGDLRNCLLALGAVRHEVAAALQYRFSESAHPVGNLLLAALSKVTGDDLTAIRLASTLLRVDDVVLPATTRGAHLIADLVDGRTIRGECEIRRIGAAIARLRLEPIDTLATTGVVDAIRAADAVIIGPGSLYSSVLATLVVPGIVDAVVTTSAIRIYVSNLMTEPGETDDYGLAEHLEALAAHGVPSHLLDYVVVNTAPLADDVRARYAASGSRPLTADGARGCEPPVVVPADVLEPGPKIRHAADKLGPILCRLAARELTSRREAAR